MYLKKFLARFVGLTVAGAVSAVQKLVLANLSPRKRGAEIRFVPCCGESLLFHLNYKRKYENWKKRNNSINIVNLHPDGGRILGQFGRGG